ncbi:membrane protein [Streptomyces decoyicus]|nr:membrane protein [Streptomyces decoyicus]
MPLRGYATLASLYAGGVSLFALGVRASGRPLPTRIPPWDLLLLGAATYKASRMVAKDKITSFLRAPFTRRQETVSASEVTDEARGHGLRLATGELLTCPFCLASWVGGALVCGYAVAPRATRLVAGGLSVVTIADWLQYAWSATQQQVEG